MFLGWVGMRRRIILGAGRRWIMNGGELGMKWRNGKEILDGRWGGIELGIGFYIS